MENMTRTPETDLDPPVKRLDPEHVAHVPPAVQRLPASARLTSAAIWHGSPDLDQANEMSAGSAIGHLGIEFTELGPNHLTGRMPVDSRTRQPFGILHGGASVLLAETLVSCAATFVAAPGKACVGMEINANHLRPVTSGWSPASPGRSRWAVAARSGKSGSSTATTSSCAFTMHDGGDRRAVMQAPRLLHCVCAGQPTSVSLPTSTLPEIRGCSRSSSGPFRRVNVERVADVADE